MEVGGYNFRDGKCKKCPLKSGQADSTRQKLCDDHSETMLEEKKWFTVYLLYDVNQKAPSPPD